jgi:hypothetical protein
MFKSAKFMLPLLVSGVLILTGCTKEGPVGPQGAAGTNGTNGNANVTSLTKTVTTWTVDNTVRWIADIPVPAITQSIVDRGAVLVYRANTNGGYNQLPITYSPVPTYNTTIECIHSLGNARILVYDSDGTLPNTPAAGQSFKVVVIAPSARAANPDLNWSNYEVVKNKFNLD